MTLEVPVVDLDAATTPAEIVAACRSGSFFGIAGHGIDRELLGR